MDTTAGPLDAAIAGIVITVFTIVAMWLWLWLWEHTSEYLYWRKVRRYSRRADLGFKSSFSSETSTSTNREMEY